MRASRGQFWGFNFSVFDRPQQNEAVWGAGTEGEAHDALGKIQKEKHRLLPFLLRECANWCQMEQVHEVIIP